MIALMPHPRGTILGVRAQPKAKKDAILGERAGALRVAVTAPPERGQADAAIVGVLADFLGLKRSKISLLTGEASRDKRLLIESITPENLRARIDALLASPRMASS
jgi:uncharacterized protein (TIGR00251 family)